MRQNRPLTDSEILTDINSTLPPSVDWKAGAADYLRAVRETGVSIDALSKPFWRLTAGSPRAAYEEVADLLGNFVDVFKLLNLPAGARILDVACGTGWLAHFWSRLGYAAYGFDICQDFIELARQRFSSEPSAGDLNTRFQVHDIETAPLYLPAPMDAAIFESCFHHFYNPIAALRNVGSMLSDSGLAVLIEGGTEVTSEFRDVMLKYRTIERPYSRSQMKHILRAAGMPYFVFFAPCNHWIPQGYTFERNLESAIEDAFHLQNRCICAKTESAIKRIVPDWAPELPVEMASGFWKTGTPGGWWCAPHARLRVTENCDLSFLVMPSSTNQLISVYSSKKGKLVALTLSERQQVRLEHLVAGEHLDFCSDQAFSPSWSGAEDSRLLSFSLAELLTTALVPMTSQR